MLKTIIVIAALALVTPAFAGEVHEDPASQGDPSGSPEEMLGSCLQEQAHMTWIKDVHEYEKVRFSKPDQFYFGSRLWISAGTNTDSKEIRDCLGQAGAHRHQ